MFTFHHEEREKGEGKEGIGERRAREMTFRFCWLVLGEKRKYGSANLLTSALGQNITAIYFYVTKSRSL